MNYPVISSGQVQAAAGLAEVVADRYGCVGVISRAAFGTAALLDQTAQELSGRRIRCVRVQGPATGGLASRDLIAQIVARPDPGALTDADLKAGFKALTEPGEGFRRVALLVSEAHSLLPSALRYVQLARQASPAKLCVVLAGKPGLAAALEGEDFIPLRSAMHMMELSEPAGAGLFDKASALPEPPPPRAGGPSPLVRLGLAAAIIPIVGLIWWRHLPAAPQDAPSVPVSTGAPNALSAVSPPAAPPPAAAFAERVGEPAPPEPGSPASPRAVAGPAADPAPPVAAVTVLEPPAPEVPAKPEVPAEHGNAAEPLAATELPAPEPAAAVAEPAAPAADPPAAAAAEPPAALPERGEAPAQETVLADPAPQPAAPVPDAGPSTPEPAIAAKPSQPHGTLTVTTASPAQGGARRAPPAAVPQAAASPARPAEDQASLADEKRCRTIVFRAQLGKDPSDADKQFLRNGCRGG